MQKRLFSSEPSFAPGFGGADFIGVEKKAFSGGRR